MDEYNKKEDVEYQQAVSALKDKNYFLVNSICENRLLIEPSNAPFIKLKTSALINLNQLDLARINIEVGLKVDPNQAIFYEDLGGLEAIEGNHESAIIAFKKAIQLNPRASTAHRKLAQSLADSGHNDEVDDAFQGYLERDEATEQVAIGADHWRAGRVDEAVKILITAVRSYPDNVNALRFLALVYIDKNNLSDAEALLRRAIGIAPDFTQAIDDLARLLTKSNNWPEAIQYYTQLVALKSDDALTWAALANAYAKNGECEQAIRYFKKSITINPDVPGVRMSIAHQLKTIGMQDAALENYRESIRLKPDLAESYWSMANLKIFNFQPDEIKSMENQLLNESLDEDKRAHFHFSLGKAYEDLEDYKKAWQHYHEGNQLKRSALYYDPVENEKNITTLISIFNHDFVNNTRGLGNRSNAPIFIVGLPRSGSTLIEQILSSHSHVEGTAELPNINITTISTSKYRNDRKQYPHTLEDFTDRDWKHYGKEYLDQTAHHRIENKPYFIDKLPNNFNHVGWIKTILPNAKIIVTRRHPIDSCLGAYKQLFAKGQEFTYDMFELAEYYQNFIRLTEHWKQVYPGELLEVHYEDTVNDLEGQVRRLLDFCGLPFDPQCLKFHETKRAIRTASSEQVRTPLYKGALGLWKKYDHEGNLDLWQEALADIIDSLPESVKLTSN